MSQKNKTQRVLFLLLTFIMIVGAVGWLQISATPAAAQEPGDPNLVILLVPVDETGAAEVTPPPVFEVGDVFTVAIVAQGVEAPGIFGGQFDLNFDTPYLQAVGGSLEPGADLPVSPVQVIDNGTGLVQFAGSRQGDVDNLVGDVVLATLSFEAIAATEPPEGQTTTISLQNVKLGAKGGIDVPIAGTADLSVIIREGEPGGNGEGDIIGSATVEGRAADNQADHVITATDGMSVTLTTTTALTGSFIFDNAPAGTYSVTAEEAGFLAATCEGVVHTVDALTSLTGVMLLAGDIDSSGEIDITDATAIGAVFGSTDPQVADLNDDGVVDILDLILMAANFGQTSAGNPWVCQSL